MMVGWSMGPDAWLLMGIWVVALTVAVWLLVRDPGRAHRDDPLEILRSRLSRGEISRDEYEQVRRLLGL